MSKISMKLVLGVVLCVMGLSVLAAGGPKGKPAPKLAIQLGAPFRNNAILQREMKVPVWGWSKPGTKVTVAFAGQKKGGVAGKDGKWMVKLDELKASFKPAEMVITEAGGKSVTLKNILVGEVWMASGQSNMQWTCTKSTCNKLKVAAVDGVNPIREFQVTNCVAQLHPIEKAEGAWMDGNYLNYSAIAFAFAHKIYHEIKVPIAILNCSWSQTAIQAWVPREGWATAKDEYSKNQHQRCLITDPTTPEHTEAWAAFYKSLEDQIAANIARVKKGEKAIPVGASVPGNMRGNRDANWLFNGRLNPVIPYAIRGAIWNQGYANAGEGIPYYNNLHSMIRGWRFVWDRPNLPVYFHQFYCAGVVTEPGIDARAEMRLGTWLARDIPNANMASQIDIGGGIHYGNKAVPGQRLALHALKNQYGKKIVADGPMYKGYKVDGSKVIIEFEHAEGGLVVADTSFNRSRDEGATGMANPKVIPKGEDKIKIFWLAGKDRVWHPAKCKIEGSKVVVTCDAVKKPRGVSYGSAGIGFQPCLYNKAMLPMTPFIYYDNKLVTSKAWPGIDSMAWPDPKLKIAGKTIDPNSVGLIYAWRKMPILPPQFRENAVLQAGVPVTFWGSTQQYGEWGGPAEGKGVIQFQFGDVKKTIPVTEGMDEWSVTLPARKATTKPTTLTVSFTLNGELAHKRIVPGIVFGDVVYVAAPAGVGSAPKSKKKKSKKGADPAPKAPVAGPIIRMMVNQSKRSQKSSPSRFSVCVSRTPRPNNRFASYWKPATGLAGAIGQAVHDKTGNPVGVIFMQSKVGKGGSNPPIKNWVPASFLKDAPSMMEDYKTVGSQYPDNPYYNANIRRYIGDWKKYWSDYIPAMMKDKIVPDGVSWGHYPTSSPKVGDSKATQSYNVSTHCFTPAALRAVVFIASDSMVKADQGANFGPEMTALANGWKKLFGGEDVTFIYTIPSKTLAPKITKPKGIKGKAVAIEVNDWKDVSGIPGAAGAAK